MIKNVVRRLETLSPDEHAAKLLISKFRSSQCQPWLTAYLLGCNGHRAGYDTVKAIFSPQAGSSAEGYAAVAMGKILGVEAYDDLRAILFGAGPEVLRRNAAMGMEATLSPRRLADFIAAYEERRLPWRIASWCVANCNPSDDWLLFLLYSTDLENRQLGYSVVERMAGDGNYSQPGRDVAHRILQLTDEKPWPRVKGRRQLLRTWAASLLGGSPP